MVYMMFSKLLTIALDWTGFDNYNDDNNDNNNNNDNNDDNDNDNDHGPPGAYLTRLD